MSYTYDVLGQLKTQTDVRGNTYDMVYDALGRMKTKTGTEGTITYDYDTKLLLQGIWEAKHYNYLTNYSLDT